MSPNTVVCGNLNLATEIRKNNRVVVCKMLLTTLRVAFTYVLSNVLYSSAAFYRSYVNKRDEYISFYWLAVNFVIITHTVEIFNLYSFDKDFRRVLSKQLNCPINTRRKKYSENRKSLYTITTRMTNVLNSQR